MKYIVFEDTVINGLISYGAVRAQSKVLDK